MKGKFTWSFFLPKRKLSADGSTTNDTLLKEKKRLEDRLVEIPKLVANLQNSIRLMESDITWLNGLNDRRRKDWEKENGRDLKQAVYDAANRVVDYKAQVDSLNAEKSRIPAQLEVVNRQLEALVKGESAGLSRGLTSTQAQALGELELQKEQEKIVHESEMQQVELQRAQAEAQAAQSAATGMSSQMKWGLIIGGSVLLLAIIGYILYQRKQAALTKTLAA